MIAMLSKEKFPASLSGLFDNLKCKKGRILKALEANHENVK
jgi:hypothetical protein